MYRSSLDLVVPWDPVRATELASCVLRLAHIWTGPEESHSQKYIWYGRSGPGFILRSYLSSESAITEAFGVVLEDLFIFFIMAPFTLRDDLVTLVRNSMSKEADLSVSIELGFIFLAARNMMWVM